jgi:phosphoribosyl-dephospho-CoA transferase
VIDGLHRHDLLDVAPAAWRQEIARQPEAAARALLGDWAALGRPVMVRRYQPGDAADRVPVAVSLPREFGQPGFKTQIRRQQLLARRAPVALAACVDMAPTHWRSTLEALLVVARRMQVMPLVFGSLMWERVTGLRYLSDESDLDLLWHVQHFEQALLLSRAIAQCAAVSPMRVDGEFLLPDGAGVHWREWLDGADEVVVKTMLGVESRALRQLFACDGRARSCR